MTRKNLLRLIVAFGSLALGTLSAQAQAYNYTSIDYPKAIRTRTFGIGPGGVIVGDYRDSSATLHGFLLIGGRYITVDVPGALVGLTGVLPTSLKGINPAGDIVGFYLVPPGSTEACTVAATPPCQKGFLLHRGVFSTVVPEGHEGSIPQRITPTGNIYGCYHDLDYMGSMFGFTRTSSGEFTSTNVPASMSNGATPDGSTIVGLYTDMSMMPSHDHGYLIQNGHFQPFDVPGSTLTWAWDINPSGTIIGEFRDAAGVFHGFLRTAAGYTSIDFPAAIGTHAIGINPGGAIVGTYTDTNNVTHGFLATPTEEN